MGLLYDIEQIVSEICDKYCKYPEEYGKKFKDEDVATENLCNEKCDHCPLMKL